ncbi:MAG: hypothetical protein Q4D98_00385 [Planctomycetia bacterium]|nr:hypothetical protein [Planctomycetia bacterium]
MAHRKTALARKLVANIRRSGRRIKQAKAQILLKQLGLKKEAFDLGDMANTALGAADTAATIIANNPGLTVGTGLGTLAGGIGLANKKNRTWLDYLMYLGGGGAIGGSAGAAADSLNRFLREQEIEETRDKLRREAEWGPAPLDEEVAK